jgi:hypothetical protein
VDLQESEPSTPQIYLVRSPYFDSFTLVDPKSERYFDDDLAFARSLVELCCLSLMVFSTVCLKNISRRNDFELLAVDL